MGARKKTQDVEEDIATEPKVMSTKVTELPSLAAEPAPLGLIGLAVAALVLGLSDLGQGSVAHKSLMIPWTLFLGATAQFIAGIMEYRRNNVFGATTFTTYSMLWYSVSLTLFLTIYHGDAGFDLAHYAHGLIGFMIFSLILTLASAMTNKVFFGILIFIDLAIFTLVTHILFGTAAEPVGASLIGVSVLSFYGAMAILVNTMAGKQVFPMGGPVWTP